MYIYNAPCSKTKHTYGKWRTNDLPVEKGDFHSCDSLPKGDPYRKKKQIKYMIPR